MKTTKLFIASIVAGGIALVSTSCVPETPCPVDPAFTDSIWNDPYDTTGTGGGGTDTTGTGGGTDSTFYGGGSGTPGGWLDSVDYTGGTGGGGIDSTWWGGDSTNFGG